MRETTGREAPFRVAQVGNFKPTYSTENELLDAIRRLEGVEVTQWQEDMPERWVELTSDLRQRRFDLVLWTSTEAFANYVGAAAQLKMLDAARRASTPVIGYHLDRFIGLEQRQDTIPDRPFFSVDTLYTADGGHQQQWVDLGVEHAWMPPAISERWCRPGMYRHEYACDVVFVGSWEHYAHKDWPHRAELIQFLRDHYGDRCRFIPAPGHDRIRGLELNDVYWSAKVAVGDSCLTPNADGTPVTHYCSDRVPETLGRGGILIHPSVEGVDETFGRYLPWDLGDWDLLRETIDTLIEAHERECWSSSDGSLQAYRLEQIEFINEFHTYTARMREVLSRWGWSE